MPRRPRTRILGAVALATALALSLSSCFLYPTAANAIADLREFAMRLDGVESVETLQDTPENMAMPFGGTALGTAAVRLGDDWRETLPEVAEAVQHWLETEQSREKVDLGVAIVFPFGAIGITSSDASTRDRVELVDELADDERLTGAAIGFDRSGTVYRDNSAAAVTLGRAPGVTVRELVERWGEPLHEIAPHGTLAFLAGQDVVELDTSRTLDGARNLESTTTVSADDETVAWADAIDAIASVTGWWINVQGEAQVGLASAATLDEVERTARSLPGFESLASLTFVTPQLELDSEPEPHSPARDLGIAAAADGVSGVVIDGSTLSIQELDVDGMEALLDAAERTDGSASVLLDTTVVLEGASGGCGCIRVGGSPIGHVADVVPPLLDLDPAALNMLWVRDTTGIDASYESLDWTAVAAFLDAAHDEAIANGSRVGVTVDSDDFFIAYFDAAPRIADSDVWAGNNDAKRDKRHAELADIWNGLG